MAENVQATEDVSVDPLLGVLVTIAQESDFEISVTLTTNGGLITGLLTGRDRWLQEMADLGKQFGEHVGALGTGMQAALHDADLRREPGEPIVYGYIHLRDAFHHQGPVTLPNQRPGFLWRGRLSTISGWSLGTIIGNEPTA